MWVTWIAIGIALFFAMNIGASGAAASMGVAYGSGAIQRKITALCLVAVGVFLGAYLGGGEVVKTLGSGIIPSGLLTVPLVIIILLSATVTLFGANMLGIPLSTSEVTVGAVVGVGIAYESVYAHSLLLIVSFWIALPVVAFALAWGMGHGIRKLERRDARWKGEGDGWWTKGLMGLVIVAGFTEAFSAGMNNVANAVGPLVGAGVMGTDQGILWGGLFVAAGALLLGGRVLETNGKKITRMSLLQGTAISGTGGVLVILSSLFGIPVPLTQITTTAILGMGSADHGFQLWQKGIVLKILKVWLVSPLLSMAVSFTLVKLFIEPAPYLIVVLIAIMVSLVGLKSLYDTEQAERRAMNEEGAGI
ncbi:MULTISPECIES: inorganic phosphate transporter [Paenibacillus]|uniref:inorganic phosphate transporter n=1 Tax=Paenibacillus TaxID=44249 RepID=UPI0022B872E7|nr:inorganic phosphate transporter [Paenibacillus caseinilyticus]MCZ8522220.1 inorganic phosphate transporter [Paenibacillus caseinilyticus]